MSTFGCEVFRVEVAKNRIAPGNFFRPMLIDKLSIRTGARVLSKENNKLITRLGSY